MHLVIARELQIRGSHGMQAHRYPALLALIQRGRLRPDRLIGRRIRLEQSLEALPAMDRFVGTGITIIDGF
jgi:alcohol dehydrogenase